MKLSEALANGIKEKQCTKCKEVKTLDEYSIVGKNKPEPKYHSWCKSCTRSTNKATWDKNRDKYVEHKRQHRKENAVIIEAKRRSRYARDSEYRERVLERNRRITSSEKKREYMQRAREENPAVRIRDNARSHVKYHLKTDKIQSSPICWECGNHGNTEGHHHDYIKELDVDWLCGICHGKWHRLFEAKTLILDIDEFNGLAEQRRNDALTLDGEDHTGLYEPERVDYLDSMYETFVLNQDKEVVYAKLHVKRNLLVLSIVQRLIPSKMEFRFQDFKRAIATKL